MQRPCPICRKPADSDIDRDFPFCSERCRLLDLGNWASENYVMSEPAFDESMFEKLERDIAGADKETGQ
ncbi:MAG TPA: DNA gyrase inhibitor YacG [Candidatus Acidoferrales bacterium]|nr:DNA gyrase inhibitor YacG [Candidatus Acidoferrales bacterium]